MSASISGQTLTFTKRDGSTQDLTLPSGTPRGAGDGLVLDGNDLDVNPGDGIEIASDKVRVKLDGSTLARSSSGVKLADSVARDRGAWAASTSYVVGDVVSRSGNVYRCKTANSDAAFTASKWDQLDAAAVTVRGAGDGLVLDGNDLDVNPGDGIEIASDKVRVKLDGTTLSRGSDGLAVANPFTDSDETKLDGIATGAEVNVQADWDQASTTDDSYIRNKPTIPTPRGAGDGLVLNGNALDVNPGDGIETDSDKVRVKLDGSTLTRDSDGLSVTDPYSAAEKTKLAGDRSRCAGEPGASRRVHGGR